MKPTAVPFDPEIQEHIDCLERYIPGFAVFMSQFAHQFEQNCRDVLDASVESMYETTKSSWGNALDAIFTDDGTKALFRRLLCSMMARTLREDNDLVVKD